MCRSRQGGPRTQRGEVIRAGIFLPVSASDWSGRAAPGKTTLMGLLLRMHDVAEGAIRIDGQDIREVTQDSLRQPIALIPQDTTLFHRSLLENIRLWPASRERPRSRVRCARAHAHEFIRSWNMATAPWSGSAAPNSPEGNGNASQSRGRSEGRPDTAAR